MNGEAVATVNGEINEVLHEVKYIIISEVFKDLYKSKASWRMFLLFLVPVCNLLYSWASTTTQHRFQPTTAAVGWAAGFALQQHLPVFPHHILESKYLRQNVMKSLLLSQAHAHLFIGQTLFVHVYTDISNICSFPSVLFLIKFSCWRGPEKYAGKAEIWAKSKWTNEAVLFTTNSFSFDDMSSVKWFTWYLLLHLNNSMTEDRFRKGYFSVLQRSKIWSQSVLDHNTYLFLNILVHEPLYYFDSWCLTFAVWS